MLKTDKFKDRLAQEKARLERMITSRQASSVQHGTSTVNEAFSNSGDDEIADAATETLDQEMDLTMLNKYRDNLTRVNAALGRIEEGNYGTCVRCHSTISEGRLDAIPETPFCRSCESDVEAQD
jgi:RNA polymerase-binding transcription factor DksA